MSIFYSQLNEDPEIHHLDLDISPKQDQEGVSASL